MPFILGAGIYDLSMSPELVPNIKKAIQNFSISDCKTLLDKAIKMNNSNAVVQFSKEILKSKLK